jgi:hypothetical protein
MPKEEVGIGPDVILYELSLLKTGRGATAEQNCLGNVAQDRL